LRTFGGAKPNKQKVLVTRPTIEIGAGSSTGMNALDFPPSSDPHLVPARQASTNDRHSRKCDC
jgi:hypothetical protein